MAIDFEFFLTLAALLTGVGVLLGRLLGFSKKSSRTPKWLEWSRSFFPVFFFVLIFRTFCFEHFRIPSGSLEPTLHIGDFILVNKYRYGLRLPVLRTPITHGERPGRGDIVVFMSVKVPGMHMIKRVVGLPGDTIAYHDKVLYVNGRAVPQTFRSREQDPSSLCYADVMQEHMEERSHRIYLCPLAPARDMASVTVPSGHYFAMGDNRDDSDDSRYWGFVPENNLVGKPLWVIFSWRGMTSSWSWQTMKDAVRWERLGLPINP